MTTDAAGRMLAKELDRKTGQSRRQRRESIDQRIAARIREVGLSGMRPPQYGKRDTLEPFGSKTGRTASRLTRAERSIGVESPETQSGL